MSLVWCPQCGRPGLCCSGHPYRPLFVEVPRERPVPRFGVLDMTGLAPLYRDLYPPAAPQIRARSIDPT